MTTTPTKTWINPLDLLPQIEQDYANHVIYGGALGLAIAGTAHALGVPTEPATFGAWIGVLGVAGAKKTLDYILEGESAKVCLDKTVITSVIPWLCWALSGTGVL